MLTLKKIKNFVIVTFSTVAILIPMLSAAVPSMAFADTCGSNSTGSYINQGVNTSFGKTGCGSVQSGSTNLASIAKTVVNIFSLLVGIVAVIMIIYGGFRYITSGGESGAVGNAKNTIIYAIIGLILVALAQTLVHFVLNAASGSVSTT